MSIVPKRRRRPKVGPPRVPFGEQPDDERFGAVIQIAETFRKAARMAMAMRLLVLGALIVLVIFALMTLMEAVDSNKWGQALTFVLGPILAISAGIALWELWLRRPLIAYRREFKALVMPMIAAHFGDFRYDPDGYMASGELQRSGVVPEYRFQQSEDHFRGEYGGVGIEFADVTLSQPGRNHPIHVFQGLCVRIAAWKRLDGEVLLLRQPESDADDGFKPPAELGRVETAADGGFALYASEDAEAVQLVTPELTEWLAALADGLGDGSVRAAFHGGGLFVAVPADLDLFEPPPMSRSLIRYSGLRVLAGQFAAIMRIVDALKSDPNAPF